MVYLLNPDCNQSPNVFIYQHEWFKASRSSKDNPKRSWYIWQPAKYDADGNRQPPNNWSMTLGEAHSAWTWDEATQEYFLSLFTPEQPDLNWENPDVRAAVHDILRFWLDRGACGFRMDVINLISKTPGFPDAPVVAPDHKYQPGFKWYANGPRLHEYLREIHDRVLSKYDTITVGEMPFVSDENEILKVVGAEAGELRMIVSIASCLAGGNEVSLLTSYGSSFLTSSAWMMSRALTVSRCVISMPERSSRSPSAGKRS